jgi:sigma-B regulation protein RsbU (phosphoserine phosphatase)
VPELPFATHAATVAEGDRLLVYSDGAFEIEKPDGQMWQYPEFVERITAELGGDGDLIERHLRFVRELHAGEALGDDFSMVEVRF